MEIGVVWFEIGSGFGEPGTTPPTKIPRSYPRGHFIDQLLNTSRETNSKYGMPAFRLRSRDPLKLFLLSCSIQEKNIVVCIFMSIDLFFRRN